MIVLNISILIQIDLFTKKKKNFFYTYPTLSDIVFLMHVLTFDLFHITLNLCIFPFYSDVIACFGFLVLFSLIFVVSCKRSCRMIIINHNS